MGPASARSGGTQPSQSGCCAWPRSTRSEGSPLPLPETPPRHHADGLAHPALRPRLSPSASGSGSTAVANLHSAKQHVSGAGSSPTAGNG
ncbi:hypothetical protein DIPPA_29728 [Diplonema papillatum]|nr:hypothetical protein DIPPA_29728 [Diplonema papillatum]